MIGSATAFRAKLPFCSGIPNDFQVLGHFHILNGLPALALPGSRPPVTRQHCRQPTHYVELHIFASNQRPTSLEIGNARAFSLCGFSSSRSLNSNPNEGC